MLCQFLKECVDQQPFCSHKGYLLCEFQLLLLESLVAAHVLFVPCIGVFTAATLLTAVHEQVIDERGYISCFLLNDFHSGLQCAVIGDGIQAFCVVGYDFLFPSQNAVESGYEAFFKALFLQRGRLALTLALFRYIRMMQKLSSNIPVWITTAWVQFLRN